MRKRAPYAETVSEQWECAFINLSRTSSLTEPVDCAETQTIQDTSCIEVCDRQRVRATLNKSALSLFASYFAEGTVREPTW